MTRAQGNTCSLSVCTALSSLACLSEQTLHLHGEENLLRVSDFVALLCQHQHDPNPMRLVIISKRITSASRISFHSCSSLVKGGGALAASTCLRYPCSDISSCHMGITWLMMS